MDLSRRSKVCIAHGALTNSKRPESFVKGVYPTHLISGKGSFVFDENNKKYLDFICGLGTNLLGYDFFIHKNLAYILSQGLCLSLGSDKEVEVAEEIKETFPAIKKLRFLKTGTEACSASIRIARAFTKKKLILSNGYHGWSDEFVSLTPPANGIPHKYTDIVQFSDLEYVKKLKNITAAVIVEPVITDWSDERRAFLQELRNICTENGIVLIFDEIITGFRWPKLSVSKAWGIDPDLLLLGKAIANGFPLSVVGGREDIMESDYFVSSTFAGDRMALEAAKIVIKELKTKQIDKTMWENGEKLQARFNALYPDLVTMTGYPTRGIFTARDEMTKALFFQEACKAGILFGASWFFNIHHIDHIDQVIAISNSILSKIKNFEVKLEGALPMSPFAQKVRSL